MISGSLISSPGTLFCPRFLSTIVSWAYHIWRLVAMMHWWDLNAYVLFLCFLCKDHKSVYSTAGRRPANAACKWFGISSAMEGVQQSSILYRIVKLWVRFIAGRRPANLNISIVPVTWTDSEIATRRHLRSAGRGLNGVSAMFSEAF